MRRLLLAALVALAVLLAVNTIVTNRETKDAEADIGRVLDLSGGNIQIREDGPADAPTVVLLHGFATSMHWWTEATKRLARDLHVVRVDSLGHGGSAKPRDGYSMENQARLVQQALDELGVRRAILAGHSMGGGVATALTEIDPSLVGGVVMVASPPDGESGELPFLARLGFVPVLGQAIRRVVPDSVVEDNLKDAFHGDPDIPAQFVEDFRRMTYSSYDGSHDGASDFQDERPSVDRLAAAGKPLLVIYGAEDEIVDPDSSGDFKRVAGATIVSLPETGHSPHVEEPARTAALIAQFAQRQSRSR